MARPGRLPRAAPWTRSLCAALALGLGAGGTAAQTGAGASSSDLAARYRALEARLVSEGRLRTDRDALGVAWDRDGLVQDFVRIALTSEYRARGGRYATEARRGVLRRWTEPVRIGVAFGPNVPEAARRAHLEEVAEVARRLARETGHPVSLSGRDPNLHVLVAPDDELRRMGPYLATIAPDLDRAGRRAILRMPPETLCMVLARPHPDPTAGYRDAIAVVRAEHSTLMRRSCLEEELAQAMGLPGDSFEARPSIFNDDETFAVLTRHDEALLRMLYDPRLRPGMSAVEAAPLLPAIAADAMAG